MVEGVKEFLYVLMLFFGDIIDLECVMKQYGKGVVSVFEFCSLCVEVFQDLCECVCEEVLGKIDLN